MTRMHLTIYNLQKYLFCYLLLCKCCSFADVFLCPLFPDSSVFSAVKLTFLICSEHKTVNICLYVFIPTNITTHLNV